MYGDNGRARIMSRILVIDDEDSIRKLLKTVLTRKRHEVFLAENGQKGIDLFERLHPLVVILDLHMPDVSGLEVLARLRAIDPHARVIILTGYATDENEIQARTLGVNEFLKKGFSLFELGEALKRVKATAGMQSVLAPDNGM
jgi:DNA-binding response OmpR family regulator